MKHIPPFSALNQNGTEISNTSLLGQKYILFFYGQDDTPTCNKQVFTANEVADKAKAKGFAVFGVSPDKPAKHKNLWTNMD
ncbi:MAG: redoxin domain-containing protein [Saprospiraceae bacterium]|nr:redoxin domain-containing protein [Saprospiraceae bacterium]